MVTILLLTGMPKSRTSLGELIEICCHLKHGALENHEANAGFHGKILFFLGFPHFFSGKPWGFQRFPTGDPGVSNLRGRGGHGGAAPLRRAAGAGALRCRCGGLGSALWAQPGRFSWDTLWF